MRSTRGTGYSRPCTFRQCTPISIRLRDVLQEEEGVVLQGHALLPHPVPAVELPRLHTDAVVEAAAVGAPLEQVLTEGVSGALEPVIGGHPALPEIGVALVGVDQDLDPDIDLLAAGGQLFQGQLRVGHDLRDADGPVEEHVLVVQDVGPDRGVDGQIREASVDLRDRADVGHDRPVHSPGHEALHLPEHGSDLVRLHVGVEGHPQLGAAPVGDSKGGTHVVVGHLVAGRAADSSRGAPRRWRSRRRRPQPRPSEDCLPVPEVQP